MLWRWLRIRRPWWVPPYIVPDLRFRDVLAFWARDGWSWLVRIPLCCAGLVGCPDHRYEVDAVWLRPRWSGPLTEGDR